MNIHTLSDRDLRALVKYGTDDNIVRQAVNELTERAERQQLRGGPALGRQAHNLEVAGGTPAPATTPKGRWD